MFCITVHAFSLENILVRINFKKNNKNAAIDLCSCVLLYGLGNSLFTVKNTL